MMSKKSVTTITSGGEISLGGTSLSRSEINALTGTDSLLSVDLSGTTEERQTRILELERNMTRSAAEQGLLFLSIKQDLPHGEFGKWIKSAGLSDSTVRRRIELAWFLLEQPTERRKALVKLPDKSLQLLTKTGERIIEQIYDSGGFDDPAETTATALRDRIRKLENSTTDMAVELESRKAENKALKDELNRRRKEPGYSSFVEITRHESNALTDKILLCLDDLERNVAELIALPEAVEPQHLSVAVNRLYLHLNAVAKRSGGVLGQLAEHFSDVITGEVDGSLIYLPDEVEVAARERRDMIRDHEQEKLLREDARERAKPRGRGRPKKPQTKKQ